MESLKVTSSPPRRPRWYDDACGAAHGLELVGERWALLIVRELVFGPRRFGQVRDGLPGISAKVLTERLEGLKETGVLMRRTLPAPASTPVYELTPWGYEAAPIFETLGRWAARSPTHDPTLPISAASLMLSFRTMFSGERAGALSARIGFRFGEDAFTVAIADGRLTAERGEPDGAQAVLDADPGTVASIVYGGRPVEDAEDAGVLKVVGDRALVARFAALFPLPAPAPLPSG